MIKKGLFILFTLLYLTSCQWSDANLGDNYFYLNRDEAIDIGYPGGAIIYKATQKYNFSDIKILAKFFPIAWQDI